jgi:anaerobic selenocysteine-containing dehydrogenase
MMNDLAAAGARAAAPIDQEFPFRLISRRMMHLHNSPTPAMPTSRPSYNPAFLHPADLERLDLSAGDVVRITSRRASIPAIVAADATLRESLVSMSHGFGRGPDRDDDVTLIGSTPARLSTNDQVFDRYSGQPRMSNIPVRIERLA